MEPIIKVVVIGITATILALLIKRTNPEMSSLLAVAACVLICGLGLKMYSTVAELMELAQLGSGFSSAYIAPVLKCVGIGITAKLGSELCRDSGQAAIAASVELCGGICAIYVSIPLLKTLLRMIGELA